MKTTLIFLHGGPGFKDYLKPYFCDLEDKFDCIFYDQVRGPNVQLQDMLIQLDLIVQSAPTKKILVGHSWGAVLATEYALKNQNYLAGLVLMCTGLNSQQWKNEYHAELKNLNLEDASPAQIFLTSNEIEKGTAFLDDSWQTFSEETFESINNSYLSNYDLTEKMADLKIPILNIFGENDVRFPTRVTETFKTFNKQIVDIEIPVGGHFPFLSDAGRNQIFKALIYFEERISLSKKDSSEKNSNISIDGSLLMPWSNILSSQDPHEYPFKAIYNIVEKKLIYIASMHSKSRSESATFEMIENSMKQDRPDLIILEGFGSHKGISPADMSNWASQQGEDGVFAGFETAFSIVTANENSIVFVGGEPSEQHIQSEIIRAGYKIEDLIYYQFIQQLFQMSDPESSISLNIESYFAKFIKRINASYSFKFESDFSSFMKWHFSKMAKDFNSLNIQPEDIAPYFDGSLFTQKISAESCRIRDQFILKQIESALNKHDCVMVIYGGSHWSMQKNALSSSLGPPIFEK